MPSSTILALVSASLCLLAGLCLIVQGWRMSK